MSHRDAVAISQTNGITCLDGLPINGSQVFVLVVTQHSFLSTIWKCGDGNATMLTTHITVGCLCGFGINHSYVMVLNLLGAVTGNFVSVKNKNGLNACYGAVVADYIHETTCGTV